MTTPAMPELYKAKFAKKYVVVDVSDNVVVPNNLSIANDSSIYGNLNVKESAVFHNTVHIDNASALNIITPQVNLSTDVVTVSTDVTVDTQKLSLASHDDISVVADKKVSVVSVDDVTLVAPHLLVTSEVDITGDLSINGDIILNGMSVGELASNTFRPIHYQSRLINPLSLSIYGGSVPASTCPTTSFLQGWHYSDSTKEEYNTSNNTSLTKMNWYFSPGTAATKMSDFKGLNIDTTLYIVTVPFISIYTKPKSGENNGGSWYQSRLNLIYGDLSILADTLAAQATQSGLRASLTYGDYSNVQLLGYTSLPLNYEKDFSRINTASNASANGYKPNTLAEALEDIKDQEILFYTIQTDSSASNYNFTVHDYTFTETTNANDKTFIVSFTNLLQSLMG